MKCHMKDLYTFTCPSFILFLRSPDMLTSALFCLSSEHFHTVCVVGHKLDNWFALLFIFRFEWHSREFFQLSWSHLYFFLCLLRCWWGIRRYNGISKREHITQHFYPRLMEQLLFLGFFFSLSPHPMSETLSTNLSSSLSLYLNLTLLLEGKGSMTGK